MFLYVLFLIENRYCLGKCWTFQSLTYEAVFLCFPSTKFSNYFCRQNIEDHYFLMFFMQIYVHSLFRERLMKNIYNKSKYWETILLNN